MTEGVRTEVATGPQHATRSEGVTQGFPGSSAFLKALELPRLGTLWLQKGTFLHLTPSKALQDSGIWQTGVVYTENIPVPRSWDVCERCCLLVRGHLTFFWVSRKPARVLHSSCAGCGTELNYPLLLNWPEGTFGGFCAGWLVCFFLKMAGESPSASTKAY